jgi:hypothetical protein
MAPVHDNTFDVFLSHAHPDAEPVEIIGEALEDRAQLRVWLDRWVLIPGEHWQQAMAKGLNQAKTCAVCVGLHTPQGWFREEIERALNRQTKDKGFRVIPVILPDGNRSVIDDFLELRTWVDFKKGLQDHRAFHELVSGIRGMPPGRYRGYNPPQGVDVDSIRTKLQIIHDLADVIDKELSLEYQRLLLDEIVKHER